MAAIAGITLPGKKNLVNRMLDGMAYRGKTGRCVLEKRGVTLGMDWTLTITNAPLDIFTKSIVADAAAAGHYAQACVLPDGTLELTRDPAGVSPLYYACTDAALCFASEVKALLPLAEDIHELPPGCRLHNGEITPVFHLEKDPPLTDEPETITRELRRLLELTVIDHINYNHESGAWLSGGLDSSCIAALARPHVHDFHTFVVGFAGSPDVENARIVADHLRSNHHERIVTAEDLIRVLPKVLYALESFDALLVRSSVVNYLGGEIASDYVSSVFSGEGGDELFAGYAYLKSLPPADIPAELVDITSRLHNTALQRVDRCASAHGLTALVCFLDPAVIQYALRIPAQYKIRDGVEKWILRQTVADVLPQVILERTKSKFWEGSGVGNILADVAEQAVSDHDFQEERLLYNGWTLNTKEELYYYRIFREHFGETSDLSWMGRTKGAPVNP